MIQRIKSPLFFGCLAMLLLGAGVVHAGFSAFAFADEPAFAQAHESNSQPQAPTQPEETNESDSSSEGKSGDMALTVIPVLPPVLLVRVASSTVAIWKSTVRSRIHKPPELA